MRRGLGSGVLGVVAVVAAIAACRSHPIASDAPVRAVASPDEPRPPLRESTRPLGPLRNRVAYVPAACFTRTQTERGAANPCYVCHTQSDAPNFASDDDLQKSLASLPTAATKNPWTNLLDPPFTRTAPIAEDAILAYVRDDNYGRARERIALADARYVFDERGFDRDERGGYTGWRAFAYDPLPGSFLPTNGSFDDVLLRLDPRLREDLSGRFDRVIYEVNLAIVESLIRRADVAIDPVDEGELGVDLDLDGRVARATRVRFDATGDERGTTRMHYVGLASVDEERGAFPIAPGLFPIGTEMLHSVRYLDVGDDGVPRMAARMKELRYAKKLRWASYAIARASAIRDAREQDESPDGAHEVKWSKGLGVYGANGWLLEGFIEDAKGALREQTREEAAYCQGCHGGIGATTDGTFAFARKIVDGAARGWLPMGQRDLRGAREPRRLDGAYEYAFYLEHARGGDELRANDEVIARFFDASGGLRADEVAKLHDDLSRLLLPSRTRAIDLDRAYLAIVREQSFERGRDVVLAPAKHVRDLAAIGEATGIQESVKAERLAR